MDALGFLDSICITVFMSLCDIVGISDRLADHDSLSTQCYFQDKRPIAGVLSVSGTLKYADSATGAVHNYGLPYCCRLRVFTAESVTTSRLLWIVHCVSPSGGTTFRTLTVLLLCALWWIERINDGRTNTRLHGLPYADNVLTST